MQFLHKQIKSIKRQIAIHFGTFLLFLMKEPRDIRRKNQRESAIGVCVFENF